MAGGRPDDCLIAMPPPWSEWKWAETLGSAQLRFLFFPKHFRGCCRRPEDRRVVAGVRVADHRRHGERADGCRTVWVEFGFAAGKRKIL